MTQSMTAFSRSETTGAWGSVIWELRCVNQRYLDIQCKLPEDFRFLEPQLKERVKASLSRGKLEIFMRLSDNQEEEEYAWDKGRVKALAGIHAEICQTLRLSEALSPFALMRWSDVIQKKPVAIESVQVPVLEAFDTALIELVAARHREGEALSGTIEVRLEEMTSLISDLGPHLADVVAQQQEKLTQRLEAWQETLEPARVAQEAAILAQRLDVSEEIDRLSVHIQEVRRNLAKTTPQGRRLDFLMQEMNREANTLASKSTQTAVTQIAVELKVLIEQMREQIQNIE